MNQKAIARHEAANASAAAQILRTRGGLSGGRGMLWHHTPKEIIPLRKHKE